MSKFVKVRQYSFLEFDPKLLCLGVIPTEYPNEAKPVGYKTVVNAFGANHKLQAALNGPMAAWSKSDKWKSVNNYDKTETMFLESAYFQKDTNVNFGPSKVGPRGGLTVGVRQQTNADGTVVLVAYSATGWSKDDSTTVAVQLPFTLVSNGKPTGFLSSGNLSERNHRPALGVTKSGTLIMGGGYGSCIELAQALVDAGAKNAGYLDGGGSYHFLVAHHVEHNVPGDGHAPEAPRNDFFGPPKDRPTPSWVLVLAETDSQVLV